MNLQINLNYEHIIKNIEDSEDINSLLIIKFIKEIEKEIFSLDYKNDNFRRRILKDFVFYLHNIRREIEKNSEKVTKGANENE